MSKPSVSRLGFTVPVVSIYPLGVTAGCPPGLSNHPREERSYVSGWSQRSSRGNTQFLYSVIPELLTGIGFAVTLTVKNCPPTHKAWKLARERFFQTLRRRGAIRVHWVTEWQRRGVPHLHAAVWFEDNCENEIIFQWLLAAADYMPLNHCQTAIPIHDAAGWFKYLAKHAARGVSHYQRSPEHIPDGWLKTGRMWGRTGNWPTQEPGKQALTMPEYWRLRRLARNWRKSTTRHRLKLKRAKVLEDVNWNLRKQGFRLGPASVDLRPLLKVEIKAFSGARKMLRCHDPKLSSVRGISDWISVDISLQMIRFCTDTADNEQNS